VSGEGELVELAKVRAAQAELGQRLDELAGQGIRPIPAEELEGLVMAKGDETQQVAFRFEASLLKRLDAHAERMGGTVLGLKCSRADAVRNLLLKALAVEESKAKR
jgi:hypothetical protein